MAKVAIKGTQASTETSGMVTTTEQAKADVLGGDTNGASMWTSEGAPYQARGHARVEVFDASGASIATYNSGKTGFTALLSIIPVATAAEEDVIKDPDGYYMYLKCSPENFGPGSKVKLTQSGKLDSITFSGRTEPSPADNQGYTVLAQGNGVATATIPFEITA